MLEQEIALFTKNKKDYLKHYSGQFVLIHSDEFGGSFSTAEQAYIKGLEKYGNVPFLIKHVLQNEPPISMPAYTLGLLKATDDSTQPSV